jgi:Zn-dependent protease
MSWAQALLLLPGLIIGLTVHEFAHAWSASLLGDNFPRRQGRVSLNPLRHLSPLGTLAIFLLPFGWGKPVVVNLYNFKHPKRDYLVTSLAGPLANVVVAIAGIGLMHLASHPYRFGPHAQVWINLSYHILSLIVIINVMLAVLNLIPIPPLDGSKIWPCLIPGAKPTMGSKVTWIFVIILAVLLSTHSFSGVIGFALKSVNVLLPQSDEQAFSLRQSQGIEAYKQRRFPDAQRFLTEAMAINPGSDSCYYWRACAKGYQQDWAGALEDMDQAIERRFDDPDYYKFRADVLTALGRKADAEADRLVAAEFRRAAAAATQPAR